MTAEIWNGERLTGNEYRVGMPCKNCCSMITLVIPRGMTVATFKKKYVDGRKCVICDCAMR